MSPQTQGGTKAQAEARAEDGFIEYLGSERYGTEFEDVRQITRREAKQAWDVSIPKDLRWTKARSGPNRGRMLLPLSEIPAEVVDLLLEDPAFVKVGLDK